MRMRELAFVAFLGLENCSAFASEAAKVEQGTGLTVSQMVGTWDGVGYGRGTIDIRPDGTYLRYGEPGGHYTIQGKYIVFDGKLAVWGGGRAFIDEYGLLKFYWDQDGYKLVMTFKKK